MSTVIENKVKKQVKLKNKNKCKIIQGKKKL